MRILMAWIVYTYLVANAAAFVAAVCAAIWGKDDPRFEGDKLTYRS